MGANTLQGVRFYFCRAQYIGFIENVQISRPGDWLMAITISLHFVVVAIPLDKMLDTLIDGCLRFEACCLA